MMAAASQKALSTSMSASQAKSRNAIPITNTSIPQINSILIKLQLIAPSGMDHNERIKLLRCSCIFQRYFSNYDFDDIFAIFQKSGDFVDFYTQDSKITGIFGDGDDIDKKYPCTECGCEVTDEEDDTGFGHRCSGCDNFFHNSCMSKPVSIDLYTALHNSPNYVRVYCPQCYRGISSIETKITDILDRLKSVEETVGDIRGIESHPSNKAIK